jgi:hypothetical protein
MRVLRANRAWQRHAKAAALATLLASETPEPDHCGDVLSAARETGGGELIVTDSPWLVAGQFGTLLAPGLARHVLRMHLGAPLPDDLQYWNRWDDGQIVVRDISDLARRYRPLQVVRWPARQEGVESLGVVLPASEKDVARRTLLIRTGRIDDLALHDGLPPEPLVILMKMLAREAREQTLWARRYLAKLTVIWQFDAAVGLRYAANYASAVPELGGVLREVRLGRGASSAFVRGGHPRGWQAVEYFAHDEGIFGDASLEYQSRLGGRVRAWVERAARA